MLALAAALAAGCGNDNSLSVSQSTRLRAVNAATDAATIRVQVGGKTLDNIAYGKGTDYQTIDAGNQELRVQTVLGDQTIYDKNLAFTAGADYTVLVAGAGSDITVVPFTDDNARPATGQAKFRLIHAAAGGPTVDVYITAPSADLTMSTPQLTSLSPGNASSYAQVAAGSYQIRITESGSKTVLVDLGTIALNEGDIQTGVLVSAPGGGAPYAVTVLTATAKT